MTIPGYYTEDMRFMAAMLAVGLWSCGPAEPDVGNLEFCEAFTLQWCSLQAECSGNDPANCSVTTNPQIMIWCCDELRPKNGPAEDSACSLRDETVTSSSTLDECLEATEHLGCPQILNRDVPAACFQ